MGTTLQLLRLSEKEAQRLVACPGEVEGFIDQEDHPIVDVDKAWGGLNFLLTGIAGKPGGFLVDGGRSIGRWKWFGSRPRLMLESEVQSSARLLASVSEGHLRGAYDPATMIRQRIYPNIWSLDSGDTDALDYLLGIYEVLQAFVAETSRSRDAMILDLV